MRTKRKGRPWYPEDGALRTRWAFLLLPKSIPDDDREDHEIRWLCFARWEERFQRAQSEFGWEGWQATRWLE